MHIVSLILRMAGGLCLFLYGMKIMSDGIQQGAGDRLRKTLNFMTGNRFAGILTGFVVTAIIQSSSATTVMVVSFVNAGLLSLTQAIGVIMGANVGTTVTAWIVSLFGFSLSISSLALPAVGIGFIISMKNWKYKNLGEFIMGFGLLFMGLHFLTQEMRSINDIIDFNIIGTFKDMGFVAVLIGAGTGLVMTMLIHSSSAATAITLTMAYSNIITYEMAAGMVLGSNVGTTIDAVLASIGAKSAAKRTALVHVMFNIFGVCWALPFLRPLLGIVHFLTPGDPVGAGITAHLAMLHTVFNVINTIAIVPFVKPFAKLVSIIIHDDKPEEEEKTKHYVFAPFASSLTNTPELNIIRVEKEIRDMTGITLSMYNKFNAFLQNMHTVDDKDNAASALCAELEKQENYIDEMREALTAYLLQCARVKLNPQTERRVSDLFRVIDDIEGMSDECFAISLLLEKSVKKDRIFRKEELDELIPYLNKVENFLGIMQKHLGHPLTLALIAQIGKLEADIKKSRKNLNKLGRKRIKAGEDIKTELLFIDLVQRIEKLGNYCTVISDRKRGLGNLTI